MRAVVVGAGIAGLVIARQLGLAGWSVDVVERSPAPRPDGYMMDFFGPGVAAAERIGLFPRLAGVSYQIEAAEYVDDRGRVTSRLDYARFARLAGGNVLSLMRPDMELAALAALEDVPAGRVRLHYGSTATRIWADDGGAGLTLEGEEGGEGDEVRCDVLIGADGIHSVVRASLFGAEHEFLRSLGMRAAAFVVDAPELAGRFGNRFVLTDSIDRMAGLYSLRSGQVAAFLVYRDRGENDPEDARERLRAHFAGLSPTVDRLLDLCPEHPYDDVVAQVVMPFWHRERAVLIGDACGAVSLLAGQGGALAIAGAALLGDLLGPVATADGIPAALAEFESQWRSTVEAGQASGRRAAVSFLPRNRAQRLLRRWIIRASGLPGVDRLIARQIVGRIAK